jgi:arylsulfatase A-like enzyme
MRILLLLLAAAGVQERRAPSIVLIVADGLVRNDLGCYDPKVLKTPRLDALAAEGMRWTQFYAGSPVPEVSRRALLTSRHAGRASVRGPLAPGTQTLTTVLEKAGLAVGTPDGPEAAERFVREKHPKPFFLLWAASRVGVDAFDGAVGRLLNLLKEIDADRDTLVVVTSNGGPRGDVSEGGLRVPMIARWMGTIAAGSSSDEHAWAGDLLPTFAELVGAAAPAEIDGESLAEMLRGRPRKDRWRRKHELYWETATAQATRFGKWKAIRSPIGTGTIELYDMSNDPGEKRDYAARRADLVRHAASVLDKRREPDPEK